MQTLIKSALFAAAGLCLLAPSRADAQALQGVSRLAFRGELGLGTMLSEHQRAVLGYDSLHVQGTLRIGFNALDWLSPQLSINNGFFLTSRDDLDTGRTLALQAGIRIEPRVARILRVWLDGNVGFVMSGDDQRFGADVGLGLEFLPGRVLGIGPYARYHHVTQDPRNSNPQDAIYWSAGLALTIRIPSDEPAAVVTPSAPTPQDADGDGVLDPEDQCVTIPAGPRPDPARRGCPINDTDRDTVYDNEDQCVDVPQGPHPDPARRGCPDGDQDSDGVLNTQDQCRDIPQGEHPDSARPGCPVPDRDNDNVPDPVDHCPDQPGAPHPDPMRNGCPGLVRIRDGQIQILAPVFFATNRDVILARSYPVLQAVADALRASTDIRRVVVEGHTDDVGNDERNMNLSQRRAWSVVEWLHAHGIEPQRMHARGIGETRPLQPIEGLRGRALRDARSQNRRVEFRITPPEA